MFLTTKLETAFCDIRSHSGTLTWTVQAPPTLAFESCPRRTETKNLSFLFVLSGKRKFYCLEKSVYGHQTLSRKTVSPFSSHRFLLSSNLFLTRVEGLINNKCSFLKHLRTVFELLQPTGCLKGKTTTKETFDLLVHVNVPEWDRMSQNAKIVLF